MIGVKRARRLLARTIKVQRQGGMLTVDGSRKRSPGGVFFFLLRDEMPSEEYRRLVNNDSRRRKREGTRTSLFIILP